MSRKSRILKAALRTSTAVLGLAATSLAISPSYAIVGNDNYTPAQLVDTTNITGVGQMVIDEGNGYVGLCTVSLINPRTVIFAAHCVNDAAASSYGSANGGTAIGFGFQAYNRTPLINWLTSDHQTSTTDYFYNSNYVVYNDKSLLLGSSLNFLQADIAMAALDTPVTNVPTWTLLFSPLTSSTHATIVGYGNYGTGSDGYVSLDFRRRVAENTISFLGSLDDVDGFLFGELDGLPQNLYQLDFNDPNFNTADANEYDFNIFHDAALAKEAITAPGDSGGPLIVDQLFSTSVIAAVLSGGTRYFSGQASSSYGTTSFYQPLYLYWDWIVANNPYKYVSAKAGDGLWSDPSHWVIDLDPNYVTIVDGKLVNALPTDAAQGIPDDGTVNTPKFGQVCYYDICQDVATGEVTGTSTTDITSQLDALSAQYDGGVEKVAIDVMSDLASAQTKVSSASATTLAVTNLLSKYTSHASTGTVTTSLGLPGTSGFVPDDTDGDATTGTPARYYDVTLSADGTTILDKGYVTIDRLTINGAKTGLVIASGAAMGTYIDTTMYAGNFRVNGLYVSVGDIALLGGVLSGNGTVVSPATTAVLGAIAPGTVGTVGTLTHIGDVVLSSGSGLLIDASPTGNDLLDVYGTLSLSGTLVVSPINGYRPKWHATLTVAKADVIENAFNSVPDTIAGVLYPVVSTVTIQTADSSYDAEVVTFQAATFASVLTGGTADQLNAGGLLDAARDASYSRMSSVYDAIDPLYDQPLNDALQALAPNVTRAIPQVSQVLADAQSGFLWEYLGEMNGSNEARVAVQPTALKLAMNSQVGSFEMRNLLAGLSDRLGGSSVTTASDSGAAASDGGGAMVLPKGVGVFLTGQKLDGSVRLGGSSGKADIDGFLISAGVDLPATQYFRVGASLALGEALATLRDQAATSKTLTRQFAVYGQYTTDEGYFVNGYAGYGFQTIHTQRNIAFGGSTFDLDGKTHGNTPIFGLQAGMVIPDVTSGMLKPAIGIQYGEVRVAEYSETGAEAALSFGQIDKSHFDARFGFDADWNITVSEIAFKPQLHAFLVTNLSSDNAGIKTTFVASSGATPANFDLSGNSAVWADVGVGLEANVYDNTLLGFHFSANPGNGDATYTAFGGSLRIKL